MFCFRFKINGVATFMLLNYEIPNKKAKLIIGMHV